MCTSRCTRHYKIPQVKYPFRQYETIKEEYLDRVDKPPYIDSDRMLFKNSYNHLRTGDQPGFTVTGSAIRYGLDGANMQPLGLNVQLKSMGIDLSDWEIPEELELCDSKLLKMFAQCVPPQMMVEIAIAQHNEWTDYGRHGGMPLFKGDGTHSEYVLSDVRMVRVDDIWRACRVVEEDEEEEKTLVCLQEDLSVRWYYNDSIFPLDRRLDTCFDTLQAQREAEAARVQSIETEPTSVCKLIEIDSNHPEWMTDDPKHVSWSPAFKHTPPGTKVGCRAIDEQTREPVEVVDEQDGALTLYFPRSGKIEQRCCQRARLEPYLYEMSSEFAGPHRFKAENTEAPMPDQWMDTMNNLLIGKIWNNGRLRRRYQAISREKDKPGISFLMGINPKTGVPYSAINRPEIAVLWMHMRELFQQLDARRPKNSRLTNIRVTINSSDHSKHQQFRDQGLATMISGGLHAAGGLTVLTPQERHLDPWSRPCHFDRKNEHMQKPYHGIAWSLTFYSDYRCRGAQPYVLWMMDSMANGAVIQSDLCPDDDRVCINKVESSMPSEHSDRVLGPSRQAPLL